MTAVVTSMIQIIGKNTGTSTEPKAMKHKLTFRKLAYSAQAHSCSWYEASLFSHPSQHELIHGLAAAGQAIKA